MEILNAIFYWTGALCWTITLFFLFLWSIGRFSIVSVKVTEESDEQNRADR